MNTDNSDRISAWQGGPVVRDHSWNVTDHQQDRFCEVGHSWTLYSKAEGLMVDRNMIYEEFVAKKYVQNGSWRMCSMF